ADRRAAQEARDRPGATRADRVGQGRGVRVESRPLNTHAPRRTVWVAAIVTALVAALLVAWFASGWREVGARQRAVRAAPQLEADRLAGELARDLRGQLEALIAREAGRPYFQYQNLF